MKNRFKQTVLASALGISLLAGVGSTAFASYNHAFSQAEHAAFASSDNHAHFVLQAQPERYHHIQDILMYQQRQQIVGLLQQVIRHQKALLARLDRLTVSKKTKADS